MKDPTSTKKLHNIEIKASKTVGGYKGFYQLFLFFGRVRRASVSCQS